MVRHVLVVGIVMISCLKPNNIPAVKNHEWTLTLSQLDPQHVTASIARKGDMLCGGLQAIEVQEPEKHRLKLMLIPALNPADCQATSKNLLAELSVPQGSGQWTIEVAEVNRRDVDQFQFDAATGLASVIEASFVQLK
jgi:hypothetical protein